MIFDLTPTGRKVKQLKKEIVKLQKLDELKLTDDNENGGLKYFYDYITKSGIIDLDSERYLDSLLLMNGASFETTSETLAAILLLLGMNADKQDILYEELKSVVGSESNHMSEENLEKLPYLALVIKESLRMLPVALVIARKVTADLKLSKFYIQYFSNFQSNTNI